jgi:hypothetical protein
MQKFEGVKSASGKQSMVAMVCPTALGVNCSLSGTPLELIHELYEGLGHSIIDSVLIHLEASLVHTGKPVAAHLLVVRMLQKPSTCGLRSAFQRITSVCTHQHGKDMHVDAEQLNSET